MIHHCFWPSIHWQDLERSSVLPWHPGAECTVCWAKGLLRQGDDGRLRRYPDGVVRPAICQASGASQCEVSPAVHRHIKFRQMINHNHFQNHHTNLLNMRCIDWLITYHDAVMHIRRQYQRYKTETIIYCRLQVILYVLLKWSSFSRVGQPHIYGTSPHTQPHIYMQSVYKFHRASIAAVDRCTMMSVWFTSNWFLIITTGYYFLPLMTYIRADRAGVLYNQPCM